MGGRGGVVKRVAFSIMLLCLITLSIMAYGSINSGHFASDDYTGHLLETRSTFNENYTNFSILTSYWLKLPKINADSNMTIYMGFASNTTNLFNGVAVGEAPQLSSKYGEYDNGKNVFLYYTNFTNLNGWYANVSKGSYSVNDGLSVNFNGPGYVVTDSTYGPGTAFMAGITSIGDVDNVGYFNLNETVNNGGGWAGAFIRLACGNTYPDQWNASGEANGCGSPYGYFLNKEGIPGTYLVEILNGTSSIQFLNGNFSRSINIDYPLYPANVGFDGAFTSISVQWAAVMNLPPNGVMPSFYVSNQVYPAGSNPNVAVPSGIIYYIPIQIANDQPVPTPNEYQQLVLVNSSAYQKYEAPNLDNVEFFYANGTVIPSWLESNNERTSGSIADLIIKVTPAYLSSVIVNGQYMQVNSSGYLELKDIKPGTYSILAENPYYKWYFSNYTITAGTYYINIDLMPAYEYHGEGEQYPWIQVGPAFFPNPFNSQNTIYLNASGHIGLIQIDPNNPDIMYIASGTAEDGIMGPVGDGGVYETYNDGGNWLPRDFGLPYGPICGFYMDPNNPNVLLVSFTNNGIYRTDDGGLWWYKVSNITGVNNFKLSGQKIFAGSNVGVIESDDDGLTWSIVYNSQYPVGPISVSGSDIYALVWGPGAPGIGESYIYMIKSNDLGATWETLHTFIGNYPVFISASPFNSSVVYLSYAGDKYTLFSEDGGITITNSSLVPVKDVVFDPKNESILWAYGAGEFFYSFNGGKSFNLGMPATDNMGLAVYPGNDRVIVLGSDQGVYQSNDSGLNWKPISGDLSDTLTYSVSVGGNGSVIAVSMQDYSAFISIDGGKSWFGGNTQPIPIGGESTDIAVNPANASWLYAYSWSGGLSVSDDGGLEFQSVVPGTPSYLLSPNALFIDPYNNSNVFFGYIQGVYNGTKYGKMWDLWTNSPADATTVTMTEQNMFLVGTTNGVYYNLNGTWLRSSGISGYVTSFAVDPANKSVVVAATGMFSPGSLYISDDYGKSFSILNESFSNSQGGLFGIPIEVYWLNITGYPLISATVNSGILISLDQGRSWVPINYNLKSGEVTSVSFNNGSLYISTYGEGVLVYPNFSIDSLPGTINGYTNVNNLNITINGQPINTYEGHFRVFLKPGNYTLSYLLNGVAKNTTINVKPMGTYNISINATPYQNYTITFTETGLPSGTQWSVTFNGVTSSSTTSNITFTGVPAGNYTWNATSMIAMGIGTRFVAPTSSGTISVPATTSFNVSYVEQYSVTIESTSGGSTSPSGTSWYNAGSNVSITAIPASGYRFHEWLTSPSISISNSSLTSTQMTVKGPGNVTAQFVQVLTSSIVVNPSSGAPGTTVQVIGSSFYPNSTVTVTYNGNVVGKVNASSSGSFTLTFTVPSLPNGTYTVRATDTMGDGASASFTESTAPVPGSSIVSSSATTYIENGTAVMNQTSTVGVSIKIVNSTVPNNYAVTVSASKLNSLPTNVTPTTVMASGYYDVKVTGLTSGMVQINITNPAISTSNTNNELMYWNGISWVSALDITVAGDTISGYVPVSALSGTPIALVITFPLTFTETGLPPGTQWSVTLNGTTYSSSTQSIEVKGLSPGKYFWNSQPTIQISNGERGMLTQTSGSISVNSPSSLSLSYVEQYLISFEPLPSKGGSIYPNMSEWVNAGSTVSLVATPSSGYRFVGWETNSSIAFTNSSSAATNAIVNSAGTIVALFKAVPSYALEYVAAAIVVVVIVIALAAVLLRRRK